MRLAPPLLLLCALLLAACGRSGTLHRSVEDCAAATGDRSACEQAFRVADHRLVGTAPVYASPEACAAVFGSAGCREMAWKPRPEQVLIGQGALALRDPAWTVPDLSLLRHRSWPSDVPRPAWSIPAMHGVVLTAEGPLPYALDRRGAPVVFCGGSLRYPPPNTPPLPCFAG